MEGLANSYWVFTSSGNKYLATKNLFPGNTVYGEKLFEFNGVEMRIWDPYRSKLSAAINKKLKIPKIEEGFRVLYLGAASGTTSSHVSDIVGENGRVFCVEISVRVSRELLRVCEVRNNMVPIIADARIPESYRYFLDEVDMIYQDVAQPNQAEILSKNAEAYLKDNGLAILAIKARSIDVTKEPEELFEDQVEILEKYGFRIYDRMSLDPFDKDHEIVVAIY
ncbi:MAG: fibrillarin-like rRNA/tRNA 2'-O-methyltransferase [Candidatus Asgardarchaeia archaeon]